jgi:SAM-dependent MidA family methyltransferase
MSLESSIRAQIKKQGDIPFVEFMQQVLYTPNLGYYNTGLPKLGVQGDFITAPELTPLFGQSIANQCQQVFAILPKSNLFEFGAGSGRLCVDLLSAFEQLNCLPQAYLILEVSSNLRQRQWELIQQEIPHLSARVRWLQHWPEEAFHGVIIANEVLDAMPVHRFLQTKDVILESFVSLNANEELVEVFKPCTNQRLLTQVQKVLAKDYFPYQSEVNLFIDDWLLQCSNMLAQGALFLIDYGFPRHEYYHPDRHTGTLMCHYRHHAHTNPFVYLGEQDITAHVDFTHIAEAAHAAGFHVAGYCNQASFLLANGLLSLLEKPIDEPGRLKAQQAVKQLIQPNEMGELFKVIALTKNIDLALRGFQLQDKRASL